MSVHQLHQVGRTLPPSATVVEEENLAVVDIVGVILQAAALASSYRLKQLSLFPSRFATHANKSD